MARREQLSESELNTVSFDSRHGKLMVMKIVIVGAGVIGAATAYYLALRGHSSTVIEALAPACAASGKSGGFLALDWCDGSDMQQLARHSFGLHAELGQAFGADTGYRALDTLSVIATQTPYDLSDYARESRPAWLDGQCAVAGRLGATDTTAQVHPELLTRTLLTQACQLGAELLIARVDGINHDGQQVKSVQLGTTELEADVVVIAMGPWSTLAQAWLTAPAINGEKGASIIVQPADEIAAQALFGQFLDAQGETYGPEVFPRPDGTVYMCGAPDRASLPPDASDIAPTAGAIETLRTIARALSSHLGGAQLLKSQACYRPIVDDALPVMGALPGIRGAYISTAHNCWGILNAPASGEAMAELITTGHTHTVDLAPFSPQRLL